MNETKKQPTTPGVVAALQANIRRYGWQALTVRLVAITLAAFFMLVGFGQKAPTSIRIFPLACLFLLWIQDGHCKYLQKRYVDLYHDAEAGILHDLVFKVDDHFNVNSLWRPTVMTPYVALIGLIALANLGF